MNRYNLYHTWIDPVSGQALEFVIQKVKNARYSREINLPIQDERWEGVPAWITYQDIFPLVAFATNQPIHEMVRRKIENLSATVQELRDFDMLGHYDFPDLEVIIPELIKRQQMFQAELEQYSEVKFLELYRIHPNSQLLQITARIKKLE